MRSVVRSSFRLGSALFLAGLFLSLTSCDAVMDLLGVTEEDADGSPSPLVADTDWSDSRYEPLESITGRETISISSEHAGRPLLYVVTNTGPNQQSVAVPYDSLQSSVSGSTASSATNVTATEQTPRAIRGIPGQFEYPELVVADSSSSSGEISASEITASQSWSVGDAYTFDAYEQDASGASKREVTAEVVTTVSDGEWSLYVWLDTDDTLVDAAMIEALSSRFMNPESDTDIFNLVTDVFGVPWGAHSYSNLVDPIRRDVHVLLYDIDADGVPAATDSRTVGYFFPKDNYKEGTEVQYSSEDGPVSFLSSGRLMFYLDSALLADTRNKDGTDDGVWATDDFWPEEVVSTLAHEFQHMVHFYQRNVVLGSGAEYSVWLNELFSMAAEEIVSRAIGVDGPRGVDPARGDAGAGGNRGGRMSNHIVSGPVTNLLAWPDASVLDHYAASYSFGAFLIRTYGFSFFTEMLQEVNPSTSGIYEIAAVEDAGDRVIGQRIPFDELLRRWGVAVIVSDDTAVPIGFRLNSGTWIGDGSVTGSVGSLNAHNYRTTINIEGQPVEYDGPLVYQADSGPFTTTPYSNLFLCGGTVPSGGTTLSFDLPNDVTVTPVMR